MASFDLDRLAHRDLPPRLVLRVVHHQPLRLRAHLLAELRVVRHEPLRLRAELLPLDVPKWLRQTRGWKRRRSLRMILPLRKQLTRDSTHANIWGHLSH